MARRGAGEGDAMPGAGRSARGQGVQLLGGPRSAIGAVAAQSEWLFVITCHLAMVKFNFPMPFEFRVASITDLLSIALSVK